VYHGLRSDTAPPTEPILVLDWRLKRKGAVNGQEPYLWAKTIAPLTTEEASNTVKHDDQYPGMAVKARDLRKRLMGTVNIESLLSQDLTERANNKVKDIVAQAVDE
jgi:hypothetical protein